MRYIPLYNIPYNILIFTKIEYVLIKNKAAVLFTPQSHEASICVRCVSCASEMIGLEVGIVPELGYIYIYNPSIFWGDIIVLYQIYTKIHVENRSLI